MQTHDYGLVFSTSDGRPKHLSMGDVAAGQRHRGIGIRMDYLVRIEETYFQHVDVMLERLGEGEELLYVRPSKYGPNHAECWWATPVHGMGMKADAAFAMGYWLETLMTCFHWTDVKQAYRGYGERLAWSLRRWRLEEDGVGVPRLSQHESVPESRRMDLSEVTEADLVSEGHAKAWALWDDWQEVLEKRREG